MIHTEIYLHSVQLANDELEQAISAEEKGEKEECERLLNDACKDEALGIKYDYHN